MARKPTPYFKFGNLLVEGIQKMALTHRQSPGRTHEKLAHKLGVAPTTLYTWRRGEHLPPDETIAELARIFAREGRADWKWINGFLSAAKYGPVEAVEGLKRELFGEEDQSGGSGVGASDINQRGTESKAKAALLQPNIQAGRTTGGDWTRPVFDFLVSLEKRVAPQDFFKFVGVIALWLGEWWLLRPFLAWPFPDVETAWLACLRYGLAGLVGPLLVGVLQGINLDEGSEWAGQIAGYKLWIVRFAAAYIGYHVAMMVYLGTAIFFYSAGLGRLLSWLSPVVLALVLSFTYALARQVPLSRIKGQTGVMIYYKFDIVVLAVFVGFGPLTAIFFYVAYPWLLQLYRGGLLLLISLALAVMPVMLRKISKRM
jgi:transcriptional regulator with XRE-family HTH domain